MVREFLFQKSRCRGLRKYGASLSNIQKGGREIILITFVYIFTSIFTFMIKLYITIFFQFNGSKSIQGFKTADVEDRENMEQVCQIFKKVGVRLYLLHFIKFLHLYLHL